MCHAITKGAAHAESLATDKTVMCGQVTAADITLTLTPALTLTLTLTLTLEP